MIEANKFKLGVFVLSGISLAFVILFILGFGEIFKPKIQFMTVFDESVQGLDTGAPVKYRGVTIGQVTRIAIRPRSDGKDNLVTVDMEAFPSSVEPSAGDYASSHDAKQEFFYEFFRKEVNSGLRCRIDMAGITGAKYVDIDYFGKAGGAPKTIDFTPPPNTLYLPSTPSLLKEITKNITTALIKISSVDFKKISNEAETTLTSLNKYLNDPKIGNMIDKLDAISANLEKTSETINATLTKDTINKLMTQLEKSLQGIDEMSLIIKEQIKDAKIGETSADVRMALKSLNQMKREISETLDTINDYVTYLDEDPGSIIWGKKQPEFQFNKR